MISQNHGKPGLLLDFNLRLASCLQNDCSITNTTSTFQAGRREKGKHHMAAKSTFFKKSSPYSNFQIYFMARIISHTNFSYKRSCETQLITSHTCSEEIIVVLAKRENKKESVWIQRHCSLILEDLFKQASSLRRYPGASLAPISAIVASLVFCLLSQLSHFSLRSGTSWNLYTLQCSRHKEDTFE